MITPFPLLQFRIPKSDLKQLIRSQPGSVDSASRPPAHCHKGGGLEALNPLYLAFSAKSLFVLSIKSAQLTGAFTVLRLQNNIN